MVIRRVAPLVLVWFTFACGGTETTGGDDDPGDGCGGGEACPTGTYCSANNACVVDGGCLVDADCATGKCSAGQVCIDPGACAVDQDCGGGMVCNTATSGCEIGGCGGEVLDLTYVPPNFLIVLDRSCSMDSNLAGGVQTKWEAAVAALKNVLAAHPTDIRWGLTLFPDTVTPNCGQAATLPFPVADNQATAIDTLLTNALVSTDPLFPDGPCVTNIDTGIQQAATDPALADPTRSNFIMLVSDGAQSGCSTGGGDTGTESAITTLQTNGVTTFVVGFGSGVDAPALKDFAIAGGAPLAGATSYYQADTANQLDQVFQSIAGLVVSCEYLVDPAPADSNLLFVFFENTESVPRDPTHADGWDYDPATMKITLYGSACTRVQDHTVDDVDVVFGCPSPPLN
jgi:hypothetical protein